MTEPIPTGWERLDADALRAARSIAAAMTTPVRELGAQAARALLAGPPSARPLTPLDRIEERSVPTRGGPRRARHYYAPGVRPDAPQPILLYLHGGGFILGTLDGADEVCRAIAARSGWDVLSLEYRLAPEHPYPAALQDAIDTLTWLRESAAELGVNPGAIAVGGDSAGGNLAAAACLHARDHGLPRPVTQILVYPAVDDRFATPSWREFADVPALTADDARWLWAQYVGADPRRAHRYAAPNRAPSLRGLPGTLVLTAEVDVLRDDAEAYAQRLRRDGVPTSMVRHRGIFHGFFTEVGTFAQADAAIDDVARHLRGIVTTGGSPSN